MAKKVLSRFVDFCPCPTWYIWIVVIVGVLLILQDIAVLDLMGVGWGPVAIVLFGLGCLLAKK